MVFWVSMQYVSCKVFCRVGVRKMALSECETLLSLIFIVKLDRMENSHQILLELISKIISWFLKVLL